jgi:hypothetical protein
MNSRSHCCGASVKTGDAYHDVLVKDASAFFIVLLNNLVCNFLLLELLILKVSCIIVSGRHGGVRVTKVPLKLKTFESVSLTTTFEEDLKILLRTG